MCFVKKAIRIAICLTIVCAATSISTVYAAPAGGKNAEQTADAQKAASFAKSTFAARTAMMKRDLKAAKRHIQTASANAQTRDDKMQVQRLKILLGYLDDFWDAIHQCMGKLQPMQEIPIKDTRIIVVTSSRDKIVIRSEGRVAEFTAEKMPTVLVRTLADMIFLKDTDSRVVIASFLAVDPRGDRQAAEDYWREGAKAGIDTELLLPELQMQPFAKSKSVDRNAAYSKANSRED